jgi:hypothetical protein
LWHMHCGGCGLKEYTITPNNNPLLLLISLSTKIELVNQL